MPVPRPKGRLERFRHTARAVRQAAEALAPDIYHFHDPELLPHGIALARKGAVAVYDVHEDYRSSVVTRGWIPGPLRKLVSHWVAKLEARMARHGWISAATPDIAALFPSERTALVQNFPDLSEFLGQPAADPAARPPRLAYVGAITEERGIFEILRALPDLAACYPGLGFDLIGPVDTALLARLQAEPGWAHTTHHGRQDRAGVVRLLSQAQIGLVTLRDTPRYRLSQPTKLYEYMAAGLPLIASDFPLWRDLVGSDIGQYVRPEPEAIAEGVSRILADPGAAARMGDTGRARVAEQYNWAVELDRLEELYQQALSAAGRKPFESASPREQA